MDTPAPHAARSLHLRVANAYDIVPRPYAATSRTREVGIVAAPSHSQGDPSTAPRSPESGTLPLHANPALRNAAATAPALGRLVDAEA